MHGFQTICFWDALEAPVSRLLRLAFDAGVRCIVSDPGRPPFIAAIEYLAQNLDESDQEKMILENWSVPHPHNCSGLIFDLSPGDI